MATGACRPRCAVTGCIPSLDLQQRPSTSPERRVIERLIWVANVRGALQGGLIAVLIDVCAGRLAYDSCDHENGFSTATADMNIHFLSPLGAGAGGARRWCGGWRCPPSAATTSWPPFRRSPSRCCRPATDRQPSPE